MKWKDVYALANRSIKANRMRSLITIVIIAMGISALVGIITAVGAIENTIAANFSQMGANTLTINTFQAFGAKHKNKRGKNVNASSNKLISFAEAQQFKQAFYFPSITSIHVLSARNVVVKRGSQKSNPNIWLRGIDENYIDVADNIVQYGRAFTNIDLQNGADVCLVGNSLAKKYFFKNAQSAVNQVIALNDRKYRIVGVLASKGSSLVDRTDNMVIVPLQNARRCFGSGEQVYNISIKTNNVQQLDIAQGEATGVMRAVRKIKTDEEEDFVVNKNDAVASNLLENIKFVTFAAIFIGLITLLGAAIGLMNIMLVAVAERTKEIGLSKAIGAQSQTIKKQFLLESIIISIKGGLWGIGVGILLGNIISIVFKSPFIIPWNWMIASIIICIIVGLASGIYPAIKASRLNPMDALRYE
jgi:putative ABC transport system permease protein